MSLPSSVIRCAQGVILSSVVSCACLDAAEFAAHAPTGSDLLKPAMGTGDDDGDMPLVPAVEVTTDQQEPAAQAEKQTSDFVAAPMPFVNPTIGAGLAAVGMYMFPASGPGTPPSKIAVGGMASENHSWGAFAGAKLHLLDDRCRVGAGGGHLDLRYDYYGTGEEQNATGYSIALRQQMDVGQGEVLWRILPQVYLGPVLGANRSRIALDQDLPAAPPGLPVPDEVTFTSGSLGLHLQCDSRDDTIYPTRGALIDCHINRNASLDDQDMQYGTAKLALNGYWELLPRHVLAARFFTNYAGEDAPFYALSCIGRGNDLRGYVDGRYRDHLLVAVQGEWRWMITDRFGLVGFAGVGEVAPRAADLEWDEDVLLPSIGAGARWRLSKTFPMSLRLDVAWGKDDGMFYVSMGEAF